MALIDLEEVTISAYDAPPESFLSLATQQGQINWLAKAINAINEAIEIKTGTPSSTSTYLDVAED